MNTTPTNMDDVVDMRDVTERYEELEDAEDLEEDEIVERDQFEELLNSLKGYGGDHQWRGDWYPGSLIRDSYFQDYAEELADDIGAIDRNANWPCNCIDWERAARELQVDYSQVDWDGVTYWYR